MAGKHYRRNRPMECQQVHISPFHRSKQATHASPKEHRRIISLYKPTEKPYPGRNILSTPTSQSNHPSVRPPAASRQIRKVFPKTHPRNHRQIKTLQSPWTRRHPKRSPHQLRESHLKPLRSHIRRNFLARHLPLKLETVHHHCST